MFNHTLSAILRGAWLISEDHAQSYLPLVTSLLTGSNLSGQLNGNQYQTGSGEFEKPFFIAANGLRYDAYAFNRETYSYGFNKNAITPGSIAVIPFIGPVMKYNGECGEPGMIKRTGWINDFANHENIIAIVNWIDSPGGQADGTPQYTDFVKAIQKPTVAFISGGAYSAGAWVASGHDFIYCADKYCGFGSIGAYTTLANFDGYYEKLGVKIKTVYPEVSKDKNKGYRDIFEKNDDTLVKEDITNLALSFINAFEENRSGKLTSKVWNTGKVFNATEALEIGLIDGIKSFEEVIQDLRAGKAIKPITPTKQSTQKTNMNLENVIALAGVENPTAEQIDLANADLTNAGITGATVVAESFITEAANVTAQNTQLVQDLAAANTAKETAENALKANNDIIVAKDQKIAELNAKIEAFGKNAGASHVSSTPSTEEQVSTDDTDAQALIDSLPHNKQADAMLR